MRLQDPLLEGFCWDHGFYSALSCPRCSKDRFFNGNVVEIRESEPERDIPSVYLVKEEQLVHEG